MPAFANAPSTPLLLVIACLALLALVLDYMQAAISYRLSIQALERVEGDDPGVRAYDPESFLYRGRSWTFTAKQVTAVCAALLLIFTLARAALT